MAENQAASPNADQKITALESALAQLIKKVDGMVSHRAMIRADSARGDDRRDDDDDDRRDDDRRADDDDDKAKKDAARDTLFGKRKDAKRRDDDKRDDARRDDEEECEEEEKEAKGDDDDRKDARGDAEEEEEKKNEPEPMASDDDRRKDRRKDARRDDDDDRKDARSDDRRDDKRDDSRSDDRRDDKRDDSRADSVIRNLQRELADLKRSMRPRRAMSDDELNALAEKQSDWDKVAQMHGQRASRPLDGERIESYDRRMAKTYQKFSTKWKGTDLADMPIEVVTKVIAPEIRADAIKAAHDPLTTHGGMQREIIKTDRTGRRISEFVGPVDAPNGMFRPFELPPMRFRGFNRQPNQF